LHTARPLIAKLRCPVDLWAAGLIQSVLLQPWRTWTLSART